MDKVTELLKQLESIANEHLNFSEELWESGDEINAQYQEGRGDGINYAVAKIRKNIIGGIK